VTVPARPTRRVAVLAPMRPELSAVVRAGSLQRTSGSALFSHGGTAGSWAVVAGVIGVGPSSSRRATEQILHAESFDHVMVVGIAGGLDPALPVGGLIVPERVRLYPDGPTFASHPLASRRAGGSLMTTDGLLSAEATWRAILDSGFGAVDMEAAGVAEACEDAGVDWSVYRGISDRPDENIVDQAVFALSKSDGSADLRAVGRYLFGDPRRVRTLAHLARSTGRAARIAARAAFADLAQSEC
jgi:nucleoside phosphorylase